MKFKSLFCTLVLIYLIPIGVTFASSIASFNKLPAVSLPKVSPDGKNIAVITNREDDTQVSISPYDSPQNMTTIIGLASDEYRIENIHWLNNARVLINVSKPFRTNNRQVRTTHLYSASIDAQNIFEIKQRDSDKFEAKGIDSDFLYYMTRPKLLSLLPLENDSILVTTRDERDGYYSSVFKVNVNTGEFKKYLPNKNQIIGWYPDRFGEILMAVGVDKDPNTDIYYYYTRESSNDEWKLIKKTEDYKSSTFTPIQYDKETDSVIVKSDRELNKDALWRYFIKTSKFELLGEAPGNLDISNALYRRTGNVIDVVGFTYNDNFVERVYFDASKNKLEMNLVKFFKSKGLHAFFTSRDLKQKRYIISTLSDKKPTKYYLYDTDKGNLSPWYSAFPELNKIELNSVTPIKFTARDNMQLNGYITLPKGVKNPPLIVFPHGGPFGVRDMQYFDPFVQLFANQGYAVLQVNFRGSGGYGNSYLTKGYGQWGKAMQTDILDAIEYVKVNKLADTNNSCIAGASYGGYAALIAGFQTPNQFKCIVSIAGVSNMNDQATHWKRQGDKNYINQAVKNKNDSLDDISPVYHASKFKAPVLLIHGKVDTRVSFRQSEQMEKALKKAGKSVDYTLFKYGTHNLDDAVNRKKAMSLMIEFINKYLK